MTHLAIFLPSLGGGGAEKVMLTLAERFTVRGVRCDLLVAIDGGELIDKVPAGVRLICFGKRKTVHAVRKLAHYLRHEKPDALLSTVFSANTSAMLASLFAGGKLRTVICESNPSEMAFSGGASLRTMANRILASVLYRKADRIVAISRGVKESIVETHSLTESDVHVIYNPVSVRRGASGTAPPRKPDLLVACGRLEPQKDYPTLLRAFARVLEQHDATLHILGEGSLRQTLEQQCRHLGIDGHVSFMGFVADPAAHMRAAAAFVHSASFEGFGLVLAEALAVGCPIVATDCPGGVREVLADGKYGLLVPTGDDSALAEAMLRVLRGEVELLDPRAHLLQFDIDHVTDQYLGVLFPKAFEVC